LNQFFCTYFDKNYLLRGVAMYNSLVRYNQEAILWVLCLDEETYSILSQMNLPGLSLLSIKELEGWEPRLHAAKTDRSRVEYYWTCSPSLIAYVLEKQNPGEVVSYLDADLFFFGPVRPAFDEMGSDSILIHGHRYSPAYQEKVTTSGIYNVGMTCFRNDSRGWEVLRWWQDACLKACYYRPDEGYCGDQKYLDHWPEQFTGVHVLLHPGVGLAPWNLENYTLAKEKNGLMVDHQPVIFFHFHALQLVSPRLFNQIGYNVSASARKNLYIPYARALGSALNQVRSISPSFQGGFTIPDLKNAIFSILHRRWVSL
jgi:hypothetical protein